MSDKQALQAIALSWALWKRVANGSWPLVFSSAWWWSKCHRISSASTPCWVLARRATSGNWPWKYFFPMWRRMWSAIEPCCENWKYCSGVKMECLQWFQSYCSCYYHIIMLPIDVVTVMLVFVIVECGYYTSIYTIYIILYQSTVVVAYVIR